MITIEKNEIMAIIRDVDLVDIIPIVEVLIDEGITKLEVSLSNEAKGLGCLEALSRHYSKEQLTLGAGTVVYLEQIKKVQQAGATFIITPGFEKNIIKESKRQGIAIFPGVFSPGEIVEGLQLGVEIFKLFPAGELGPTYVKSLRGPFPDIHLMAVGGVNARNKEEYAAAGCDSYAIGSELVPRGATREMLDKIRANAKAFQR
ncbi:bifunctional 4-hydroxy-2-oxoglutarate aldolase/2-dehydro-3-deoxy-phosphogluconate aldolase [Listeria sp. FSL L7-1517]|nr:bifunctional 4-hydroxy-2-oxoglutarate aldolase/2-dehydro-3-deoxy-phosphogluconate aldolase [Listeria immobilis]MBC6297171.1 bifunctional 4-hydroxy-2-oxoglutarate aldolase/2-dehydro-3-deoxy-phosphogluconate aldolase [Listeria immobilis]